jgi:signal transduction histidine kinase
MLSHEFRTPLATIDGAIQRLEMTAADDDEATRKRYRKIQTAVDRLLAMLDELPVTRAHGHRPRAPADGRAASLLQQAAATVPASHRIAAGRSAICRRKLRCDGRHALVSRRPAG